MSVLESSITSYSFWVLPRNFGEMNLSRYYEKCKKVITKSTREADSQRS